MATNTSDRQMVRILQWLLKLLGYTPSTSRLVSTCHVPIHLIIFIFPSTVTIATTGIYAYVNRKDFDKVASTAAYIGSNLIVNAVAFNLYIRRTEIKKILERIDGHIFTYSETKIQADCSSRSWILQDAYYPRKLIVIACCSFVGFSLALSSPFTEFYVTGDLFKIRVFPSWYPWNEDTVLGSFVIIFWQTLTGLVVFSHQYLWLVFLLFVTAEFIRQKDKLCGVLATLGSRSWSHCMLNSEDREGGGCNLKNGEKLCNIVYREMIVECFKHYQEIQRTFDLVKPWFTFFFTTELFVSTISFAFVFYSVIEFPQPERILSSLGASFNVITNLFIRCAIGNTLSELNEDITNAIFYHINWYEQSKENKRLLVIFHVLVRIRNNQITAFSVFPASYYTFAGLMRLSYSYMGLIKTTIKRRY